MPGRATPYEGDGEAEARWEAELLALVGQGELGVGKDLMQKINPAA